MSLLNPGRHQVARPAAAPAPTLTEPELLRLGGGARGWTSAGVSVAIRPAVTARELRDAAAVIGAAAVGVRP